MPYLLYKSLLKNSWIGSTITLPMVQLKSGWDHCTLQCASVQTRAYRGRFVRHNSSCIPKFTCQYEILIFIYVSRCCSCNLFVCLFLFFSYFFLGIFFFTMTQRKQVTQPLNCYQSQAVVNLEGPFHFIHNISYVLPLAKSIFCTVMTIRGSTLSFLCL